ncbi:hypothetical protein ACIQB5_15655 [Streptomyces sp. NPDC088560]|uniref:hypothetical protein n=1 Tax=Streptomyces sp. NPDC088560 TaxID=3365868 RepID=UPI0037FFADF9
MSALLPRTYWCHVDHDGQWSQYCGLADTTTNAPALAVAWVRESVRDISSTLEREAFHAVWGWLGDHGAVHAAVVDLRKGRPYTFGVPSPAGRWTWTAYPVSVLPVVETCSVPSARLRQLAPAGAIGGPP